MGDSREQISTEERVQIIALGVYRIADRFPVQEEAFGKRLKDTATQLIEDTARFRIARTRDAVGTARVLHEIIGRLETLGALIAFVKRRGQVPETSTDLILWHLAQLSASFQEEDRRFEAHVAEEHPRGAIIEGKFFDALPQQQFTNSAIIRPVHPVSQSTNLPVGQSARPAPYRPEGSGAGFDPLLGPDSAGAPPAVRATAAGNVSDRQQRILDFFALRRRAPLKDIVGLFPGMSEKTVRNDLVELCRAGNLRRVGLAPRSHYVLTA